MIIDEAVFSDISAIVEIWREAELTRPWNDPINDIELALRNSTSTILVAKLDGKIIGTAMTGYDGHRGWIYYLAVSKEHQNHGIGKKLVTVAQDWLLNRNAPKINLMIRAENINAISFYKKIGFKISDTLVLGKFIK